MIKRIGIAALAVVTLLVTGFFGYGYLSRRGAPAFEKGGAFGAPASPTAEASVAGRTARQKRAAVTRPAEDPTAPSKTGRPTATEPARSTAGGLIVGPPEAGRYRYVGEGSETIRFGSASPCSWDLEEATLDVKHTGDGTVFDWTYTDNHLERLVFDFGRERVRLTYAGAAVTCLGVRNTSAEDYEPPTDWLRFPLRPGASWKQHTTAGDRDERVTVQILRRERITVPAGTFDAIVVRFKTILSGSEEGTAQATQWVVPGVGVPVKDISSTDARRGNVTFTSRSELVLASMP